MNLPEGSALTYFLPQEAWHASVTHNGQDDSVMVSASYDGGGAVWEFSVVCRRFDGGSSALQLRIFGDSWDVLNQMPEFFDALRQEKPRSISEVCAILDRAGAVDETERVSPHGGRTMDQERALALRREAENLRRQADALDPPVPAEP
ncbi:hypothetical protein EV383_4342 [Pseudonocardia sediminis]|uniref:Uncharacterized protein n=1 Tax=Pseudonocardia sediminis TaxID=1397368 RepID=A0A4Q7V491_PSEST|nr:hypothetical protein [Pseudonocardia sediminis]RZT87419.1 hypothetical protein EV383_4342 [Pseudonocardia sediminis]